MHILNTLPQRLDSGATPTFTGLLAPSLTAPTNLTLAGGSTSGQILFNSPSATERARLTNTGNLLIGTTTDTASRLKLVGTDSSGPKTWTASSAALSGALFDSYQDSGGNGFQRYTDIVSLQDSDGVNGGGVIRFVTNSVSSDSGAEAMRVTKAQNLLIGTTTDISGTGGLHVAGTSTATSSSNGGALRVGTNVAMSGNAGGASYFGGTLQAANIVSTTATGTTLVQISDTAAGGKAYSLISAGTGNVHGAAAGTFYLRNSSDNTTIWSFTSTGAATFAGEVNVGGVINGASGIKVGSSSSSPSIFGTGTVTVTTSTTQLSATGVNTGCIAIVTGYNNSNGSQAVWLVIANGSNVSVVSSQNSSGLTPTFSISSGKLNMSLASGSMSIVTTLLGISAL